MASWHCTSNYTIIIITSGWLEPFIHGIVLIAIDMHARTLIALAREMAHDRRAKARRIANPAGPTEAEVGVRVARYFASYR